MTNRPSTQPPVKIHSTENRINSPEALEALETKVDSLFTGSLEDSAETISETIRIIAVDALTPHQREIATNHNARTKDTNQHFDLSPGEDTTGILEMIKTGQVSKEAAISLLEAKLNFAERTYQAIINTPEITNKILLSPGEDQTGQVSKEVATSLLKANLDFTERAYEAALNTPEITNKILATLRDQS